MQEREHCLRSLPFSYLKILTSRLIGRQVVSSTALRAEALNLQASARELFLFRLMAEFGVHSFALSKPQF